MLKRYLASILLVITLTLSSKLAADQNIFIFLGAPGAGKGTISTKLSSKTNLPHISTGDLLREKSKEEGELSEKLNSFMSLGELVPDDLIITILSERVKKEDCEKGFILDGFPRTLTQAKKLQEKFPHKDRIIVVNVSLGTNAILERLQGRRICSGCSKSYHLTFNPPKSQSKCNDCNGKLISRADDTIETIKKRLEIYRAQFAPIKRFYKDNYQWIDIKNELADECFTTLLSKVESINPEFLEN